MLARLGTVPATSGFGSRRISLTRPQGKVGPPPAPPRVWRCYKRTMILVVDDDPETRWILRLLLAYGGREVRCVADGASALLALADSVPECVVLDDDLAGVSGLGVLRQLRKTCGDGLPVVLFGHGWFDYARLTEATELGALDWVPKAEPDRLLEVLSRVVPYRGFPRAVPD